jgi:hypothetical protein
MAAITAAKNLLVKFARTNSILKSSKLGTSMQLLDVEQLVTFPILKNIAAAGAYKKRASPPLGLESIATCFKITAHMRTLVNFKTVAVLLYFKVHSYLITGKKNFFFCKVKSTEEASITRSRYLCNE